jgi:prolipoprotein diacylglyceryl transferase
VLLRRSGQDFWTFLDAVALGLPVAQAIARWGNYMNQELFGTPTNLPWALEIDPVHRPEAYATSETFHPTFLYESLWNLLIIVPALIWIERRFTMRRGVVFGIYLALYSVIRFLNELLRTDTDFRFLGLSKNGWVSTAAFGVAIAIIVMRRRPAMAETTKT